MLRTIKWVILILALVVLAGCAQQSSALPQPTIEPVTSEPVESTPSPTIAVPEYTSLGSDWEVAYSESAEVGEQRVYHHYITNYIQYDDLIIDDELVMVENVCYDQRQDIMDMFGLVSDSGETPQRYQSWSINFQPNCYIAFTVKNVTGDTMGVEFTSHCPMCNH